MLVRRFLGCITVLALLTVAGAFLIFQFGSDLLTRSMTPRGHYQAPAEGDPGPDYAKAANWVARPDLATDPSRWGAEAGAAPGRAAVFFVHPTTYLDKEYWNAPVAIGGETEARTQLFVKSQASAFNGVGTVWAPRYRQAAIGAFLRDSADSRQALDLAYGDVMRAFDAFLAANPAGPLILAGHSQGSQILSRLLAAKGAQLRERLVAAYVVGWPLSKTADLPAMGLSPCAARDEAGCVLSWQSFGEPANVQPVLDAWAGTKGLAGPVRRREDMVCTNPIDGREGGSAVPGANPGTLVPNGALDEAAVEPGRVGGTCENGFLVINGAIPPLGPYVLPGNNYHVYDYALFWGAVRADAAARLAAFGAAR